MKNEIRHNEEVTYGYIFRKVNNVRQMKILIESSYAIS